MRLFGDPGDLRAMQDLVQRTWSPDSRCHIGDLAWERLMFTDREHLWPTAIWDEAGVVTAWSWVMLPSNPDHVEAEMLLCVDPAHPKAIELADEVVAWSVGAAGRHTLATMVLGPEIHLAAALRRHGFIDSFAGAYFRYHQMDLADLPEPTLPDGFRARPMHGPEDIDARVRSHVIAWSDLGPSNLTAAGYRQVMNGWPYRPDLDWVIEAPDGSWPANCLLWYDDVNRVVELEPVGTDPAYRRHGLAAAVCFAALRAARDAGATTAIVYPRGDDAYPRAQSLYRSMGFTPYARTITWRGGR
jgi:GNAT superfamily N-acetyltransferase